MRGRQRGNSANNRNNWNRPRNNQSRPQWNPSQPSPQGPPPLLPPVASTSRQHVEDTTSSSSSSIRSVVVSTPQPPAAPRDTNGPHLLTEEEKVIQKQRRRIATASPFRKQTFVNLSFPSLSPDSIYSPSAIASYRVPPDSRRNVNGWLLKYLSSGQGQARIKLVKGISKGKSKFSQVWKATIEIGGGKEEKVVVKFFAEAFFTPAKLVLQYWWPAPTKYKPEMDSYAAFRPAQGVEIPICYGFFNFKAPYGENVVGVIMEDLSDVMMPLEEFGKNLRSKRLDGFKGIDAAGFDSDDMSYSEDSDREAQDRLCERAKVEFGEKIDKHKLFFLELFNTHRRIQELGKRTLPVADQYNNRCRISVVKSSTLNSPRFIYTSFARSQSEEEALKSFYEKVSLRRQPKPGETEIEIYEEIDGKPDYRDVEERNLLRQMRYTFGNEEYKTWRKMGLFPFISRDSYVD
ncbi:hypothetical protein JCM3765_005779 [Sporobolomyces pararoseus]